MKGRSKAMVEPGSTIDVAYKGLTLAMAMASEQRINLPIGAAAHAGFSRARIVLRIVRLILPTGPRLRTSPRDPAASGRG